MSWQAKFKLCKRSMLVGVCFGLAIGVGLQIMIQQLFG
jgi:hypothetical protein